MRFFIIPGIILLLHLSLFSQINLTRTQISNDTVLIGNKMIVKISFNKKGKFIPPDLSGFEVVKGPIHKVVPPQENRYNTLENYYVYILKPLELGNIYFDNSYLVSGNDTLKSPGFYFWVIPNPEGKVIKPKLERIPDFGEPVFDNLFSSEKIFSYKKSDIDTFTVAGYLQKAFNENSPKIIELDAYENGIIVPENKQKTIDAYKKSAMKGDVDAQYSLGFLYSHGKEPIDKSKALYWYEKAANQNHIKSQFQAGVMYDKDNGIPENKAKALKWFKKCAELGDVKCQFNTGYFYETGSGTKKDLKKALYWYQKAANANDSKAQYNLGLLYLNGDGVKQDLKKAYFWLNKAKEGGNSTAKRVLDELSKK